MNLNLLFPLWLGWGADDPFKLTLHTSSLVNIDLTLRPKRSKKHGLTLKKSEDVRRDYVCMSLYMTLKQLKNHL